MNLIWVFFLLFFQLFFCFFFTVSSFFLSARRCTLIVPRAPTNLSSRQTYLLINRSSTVDHNLQLWNVILFRTAVPFWGSNTWNLSGLSPKRTPVLKGFRQDLYGTDPTQEMCAPCVRSRRLYGSHPATWAGAYRSYRLSALKRIDHDVGNLIYLIYLIYLICASLQVLVVAVVVVKYFSRTWNR